MLSPVIFYTLVLAVVEVLQYFLVPLVLKNGTGEPGGTTLFYNLYIYKNFFTFQNMSYGATLAWVLFAISLVVTVLLFRLRGAGSTTPARPAEGGDPGGQCRRTRHPGRAAPVEGSRECRRRPRLRGDGRRSFLLTLIAVLAVAAFLSPMLRSFTYAIKSTDQISQAGTPLYPADPVTFDVPGQGAADPPVPLIDGTTRQLALFEPGRKQSTFIDPANPGAAPIVWVGSWRTLEQVWQFAPHWENFAKVWNLIDYPRLLFNTAMIAIIGTIGTLLSCTLVAYGFARFQFPGRNLLFTLLIATIFLPAAVTIIPTYTIFVEARLGRDVAAVAGPDVLRQRLRRLPDAPVLHDDPDRDGRGGRHRRRRAVPDAVVGPAAAGDPGHRAVAIFHLVYTWNDFFGPVLYLSATPDLQTVALGLSRFNGIHYRDPGLIQAGTLMTLVIPVIAFLLTQRFFTRGLVVTGIDK